MSSIGIGPGLAVDPRATSSRRWAHRFTSFFRRTAPTFLLVLLSCYAVYGRVHIMFMRVESGMMMEAAQTPAGTAAMFRFALSHSYGGHYVPLFFLFEMLASKVCGIHENLWRVHQFVGLTCLVMALLYFFERVARTITSDQPTQFWMKVGLTAPFIFSPLVIEFVSWPFEMGQILWATLTVLSLAFLTRSIEKSVQGRVCLGDLSLSLACAYLSIHAFGLGAATLAGWLAVWALLLLDGWLDRAPLAYLKKLAWVGAVALSLTAVHTGLMLLLPRYGTVTPLANLSLRSYVVQTLGYVVNLFWQSLRSMGGPNAWPYSRPDFVSADWVYGLGLILWLGGCAAGWYRAHRAARSPRVLSRVCWQVYGVVTFCAYVGMVSLRIRHQGESWVFYLVGPRYLWPSTLLLFGFFGSAAGCLKINDRPLAAMLGLVVSAISVGGNLVYQADVVPKVWPALAISHEGAWNDLAATANDLRRAGLPMPDLALHKLGDENYPLISQYEPTLRRLAGLQASEPLEWIYGNDITPAMWQEMKSKSPALTRLSARVLTDQDDIAQKAAAELTLEQRLGVHGASLLTPAALGDTTLAQVRDHPNLGVDIAINGISRPSIWIDAPTQLTFHHVALGAHPVLHVYAAIHPLIYTETNADGATFQVLVRLDGQTQKMADVYLNPILHPELRKWNALDVDLSKFAGKTVDLTLGNTPGPANNDFADWCIWGDPRLSD